MNLLTAVIYNQFRGYLRTTLQNSLNRRQIAFYGAYHKLLESDKVRADETRVRVSKLSYVIHYYLFYCLGYFLSKVTYSKFFSINQVYCNRSN